MWKLPCFIDHSSPRTVPKIIRSCDSVGIRKYVTWQDVTYFRNSHANSDIIPSTKGWTLGTMPNGSQAALCVPYHSIRYNELYNNKEFILTTINNFFTYVVSSFSYYGTVGFIKHFILLCKTHYLSYCLHYKYSKSKV